MMRSESAAEETTRESLDPGMDEMYGGRRSFSVSPAGQRPRSIHGAMGGGEQGIVEHLFFTLGEGIGRYAVAFTLLTICGCAALTSGIWLRGSVDTELFNSLVLRPRSRMQRETNYNVNRYDAGYASASEVTNAVADEGGKDVLTRKNLLQTARFWRDKDVLGVAVSEGGEEYSGRDVLVITAGTYQPIRYTLLDCWQEGAYDHFGSIGDLDPAAAQLEYLAYEALAPFDAEAAAAAYAAPPFVTPYAYCLYMRLVLLYTPAGVDVSLFGRCRQFLDEEPTADDAALAALKDAYDFHRFYLYDFMASKPSLYLAWACLAPFASEPAGRCHAGYTCCEIATIYSGCASGALDEATCAGYAAALGATTWYENPTFSAAYAAEAPCGDFGFYPLSSAFAAQAFGTTASYPTPTTFDDCAARYAVYAATPAADVEALVDAATRNALCQPAGANVCAALSASDTNLLWSSNIATDAEITATAVSGTCALWDGGAEGMGILPYVPLTLIKFYTQFRWLTDALVVLIAYALLGVFGMVAALFVCIQPPRPEFKTPARRFGAAIYSAFLLAFVVLTIILTLLAIMGLSGLILNCFTAVTLVVAVGISVEFTAHFLHHYLLHAGGRVERTRATLKLVLPPVLDGSITTLLGILPIAAAKYPYIVLYYFFVYLIIIGVGICFGLVVLPALLAAVGWQDGASSVRDRGDEVVHAAPSRPDPRDKL